MSNTGNWNTGYFCTDEDKVRIFNKSTDVSRKDIRFPEFFYFGPTEWIASGKMTVPPEEAGNVGAAGIDANLSHAPPTKARRLAKGVLSLLKETGGKVEK